MQKKPVFQTHRLAQKCQSIAADEKPMLGRTEDSIHLSSLGRRRRESLPLSAHSRMNRGQEPRIWRPKFATTIIAGAPARGLGFWPWVPVQVFACVCASFQCRRDTPWTTRRLHHPSACLLSSVTPSCRPQRSPFAGICRQQRGAFVLRALHASCRGEQEMAPAFAKQMINQASPCSSTVAWPRNVESPCPYPCCC